MEEEGVVLEVTDGTAKVRMTASGGCEGCAAAGACKVASGARVLEADNGIGAKPGQCVLLKIDSGAFLKASFLIYGVPVISLFIGAALGGMIAGDMPGGFPVDFWQALTGVVFLALSVIGIRIYGKKVRKEGTRPVILRVIEAGAKGR